MTAKRNSRLIERHNSTVLTDLAHDRFMSLWFYESMYFNWHEWFQYSDIEQPGWGDI